MVDGPAVGKAGDCLDWLAGGLEMKELKDSGNPYPIKTGALYISQILFCLEIARLSNSLGSSSVPRTCDVYVCRVRVPCILFQTLLALQSGSGPADQPSGILPGGDDEDWEERS